MNIQELIRKVWIEEKVPTDWRRGLIVKLPKKGDLTRCGNWRGITLIPTTAKVMGKIIVRKPAKEVDQHLREERAGFRAGRGTTEQIFILTNILEQAIEAISNLYTCFIDFEKSFDSVHRDTLWKIMQYYRIPEKFTVDGLNFVGYQFSWFLWRVQSKNSRTHEMVIFCNSEWVSELVV